MPRAPVETPDQVALWDAWHSTKRASGDDPVHSELRQAFLKEMNLLARRARVLDLGCGQGADVAAFVRAGHRVSGIDFSAEALRLAQRALPPVRWWRRTGAELLERDLAEPFPFPDDCFDGIYSHLALHYFTDEATRKIFREMWRTTRSGGVLAFSVRSVDDPYFRQGEKIGDFLFIRNGHLRRFFTEAFVKELLDGWQDVRVDSRYGRYASPLPGAYVRAIARKPIGV